MIAILSLFLLSSDASAFLLVHPQYRLHDPEKVSVNIAAGGCQANGISNDELKSAIIRSIDKYWNTVTESRLRLKAGDEVSNSLASGADPGEIIVGCQSLGAGIAGVTYPNIEEGSAMIALNSTVFVGGSYNVEGMIGTLTHELGHAIGLNHSGDPASVMTYEAHDWGPAPSYLAQDDKDGVIYLYGNEPTLGGMLGSCSAIAHDGRARSRTNPWLFFGELFFLVGALQLARLFHFAYRRMF